MAHTERVNTLFRRKTIGEECKIFLSFLMNVLDSANRQLKEIPGAHKQFWINQHCASALLQQGGVAQLYNLAGYWASEMDRNLPINPHQHPLQKPTQSMTELHSYFPRDAYGQPQPSSGAEKIWQPGFSRSSQQTPVLGREWWQAC